MLETVFLIAICHQPAWWQMAIKTLFLTIFIYIRR